MEAVALLGVVLCFVVLAGSWSTLPQRVPHHFGLTGRPDSWGGRGVLWLLPALSTLLYVGLTIGMRFPHRFNYMVPVTDQNAECQYRNGRLLLLWLKTEVVYLFSYLTWASVRVAAGRAESLGIAAMPLFIMAILGTVFYFLIRSIRAR